MGWLYGEHCKNIKRVKQVMDDTNCDSYKDSTLWEVLQTNVEVNYKKFSLVKSSVNRGKSFSAYVGVNNTQALSLLLFNLIMDYFT